MKVVMVAAVTVILTAACTSTSTIPPLPKPDRASTASSTTTAPRNLAAIGLPAVAGTTTSTVVIGPGPVTIVGRVEGPDGPVAGATVRAERLVGDTSASVEVPTAEDGTWNLTGVFGGRYRVRAWRQPDLAMAKATTLFIGDGANPAVVLTLEDFGGMKIDAAIAPNPPPVRAASSLAVRFVNRTVDSSGIVRARPASGIVVSLTGTGTWTLQSANPVVTDVEGTATWTLECRRAGDQPLAVSAGGTSVALAIPPCGTPETTTTTARPPATPTTGR